MVDLRAVGRRSVEWDLNDWEWDGDLFVARHLDHHGSSNSSDEGNVEIVERRRIEMELKKKSRAEDNLRDDDDDDDRRLTFKLGGGNGVNTEGNGAKKKKFGGGIPNRAVCCQVENCGADLSISKDYHRRHKVCEMHSKATSSLVGGIMQRFCQQCSRFHVLEEFDEGKRSCRRRLAGHNRRRRKTNPDTIGNGNPLSDDQTSNYLLISSLLTILSNIHSNQSDNTGDQDLLSHLLKSLVSQAGENSVGLLAGEGGGLQACQNIGEDANVAHERAEKQAKMNNFDLNDIYVGSEDDTTDSGHSTPPQASRNSDSASDQSPSRSNGVAQGRTDRIVFKLFGKEPNDFPVALRGQILDWLAHTPTDIESYIRPGCVVLTIYLRQGEDSWEEAALL